MTIRTWFYGVMTSFEPLTELIGGPLHPRIFAKKTMTSSVENCPYIVYKFGYSATEDLSEEYSPDRQFVQVWVHDFTDGEHADYMQIDAVIKQLRHAFRLQSSKADGVIAVKYLETSQDLNDDTLNTVFKYVRFQLITEEQ